MKDDNQLYILWTNTDPHSAQFMVMMYATNSMLRHWWENVTVIVWGGTAKLAVENETIKESIKLAMQAGVKFTACVSCAVQLGVRKKLEDAGIEVIPWGEPLTRLLKENAHLLTV